MNKSIYNISLDLHNGIAPHVLPIKQGDTDREIKVTLTEDGRPYEITGECGVFLYARFPDGSRDSATMQKSQSNDASVTIPSEWTSNPGEIECEVRVTSQSNGAHSLATPMFSLVVTESLSGTPLYYRVYWDRASTPEINSSHYASTKDANFSLTLTNWHGGVSDEYGWIMVPAEIVPESGVYIAATNGVSFAYRDEQEYTVSGETILFKRYRSTGVISSSINPRVIFQEK